MGKISAKDLGAAVDQFRKITQIPAIHSEMTGKYELSLLGEEVSPGVIRTIPISPRFETRDELLSWMQAYIQGWQDALARA